MTRTGYPDDRVYRWRWALLAGVAGLGAFLASRALASLPAVAEQVYSKRIGPLMARPLSLLTGPLPFALSEVLLLAYIGWVIVLFAVATRSVVVRKRRPLNALAGGLRRVVRDAGLLVFFLYALWGFNYARPPLEARMGWGEWQAVETSELTALAEAAVALANQSYLDLHGSPDASAPTQMPAEVREMERAIDQGWVDVARELDLPASVAARYGPVKWPWISPLLARMSLFGVYSPYTGEANVVRGVPAVQQPMSMCHEKAHQRGVGVEAEASFLGFLVCSLAADPHTRYSAASFAQGQLVAALPGGERRRVAAMRLPGVQRDMSDLSAYLDRNRTRASAVQSAVNDRYLRANRVPGGIRSYSLSVRLLVLYAQHNDGTLLPLREEIGPETAAR